MVVHTSGSSGNLFNDLPATGVVLTDGTILAGKPEIRDQRILKLERNGKRSELPWNRIAVVLLRPASASIIQPGSAVRAGVMMAGSDFLEGEITSIATNSITLNSLLFGIKKVNLDRRPVAILNAGVNRQSGRWEIRLTDDSLIYCEEPSPSAEALTIGHPWLSSFVLKWDEIADISSPARSTNEKSQ